MTEIAQAFVRLRPVAGPQFTQEARREVQSSLRGALQIGAGITGGVIAVEIFRDIGRAIAGAAKAASEEQVRAELLDQAIDNARASHEAFGHTIEDLIDKESRLKGFTDQDLSSAFARLVQATKSSTVAFDDLKRAEDISRIRKIDLGQAAIALAKAEQGSTTALARLGVIIPKVNTEQRELIRRHDEAVAAGAKFSKSQDLIYKGALAEAKAHDVAADRLKARQVITERFGGSAARFATTTSGQFTRLRVSVNEFEEALGKDLLPPLANAAAGTADLVKHLQDSDDVARAVHESGELLGDTLHFIGDTARVIGPPLLDAAHGAEAIASAVGAPALLTGIATFKGLNFVVAAGASVHAAYVRAVEAGTAASTADVAATGAAGAAATRSAAEFAGYTASVEANNVALAENVAANRIASSGFSTVVFGSRAAKTEVAALGAATREGALEAENAARGGFSTFSRGVGTLALGAVGGTTGLALIGVSTLAAGIAYAATRTSDFDREAGALRSTLGLLNADLNRTKELSLGLAQSNVDVALAKDAKAAADAAVQQAQANEVATRGTKEHQAAVLALKTARDQDAAAALAVQRAEAAQQQSRTAVKKNEQDIADARARAVQQTIALARATRANDIPVPSARFTAGGGVGARATDIVLQNQQLQRAAQHASDFAAALDKQAQANQRTAPGVAQSIRLLAAYANAVRRLPTEREVKFILDPSNVKLSLRQIEDDLGTGTQAAVATARRNAHQIGVALSDGVRSGIADTEAKVAAGMARSVQAAIDAGRTAADARSPSRESARLIGLPIAQGIAVGIDTGAPEVQRALGDTVGQAIEQGGEQVRDAITQAKQNLNTIGASLGQSIGDVLQRPLQAQQQAISAAQNRQTLESLRRSVILPGGGGLAADPAAALAQLRRIGGSNGGALAGFTSQFQQAELAVQQDRVTARAAQVQRQIADLTDRFNRGDITGGQLNRGISAVLAKNDIDIAKIARTQGIAYADNFRAQLEGLRDQVQALVGAPRLPGTGLAPSIVRPVETLRSVTQQIAQAQRDRDEQAKAQRAEQLAEAKKQTKHLQDIKGQQEAAAFIKSLPKSTQAAVSAALAGANP